MSIQDVAVVPRFADGVLQGCAVNFDVAQRDDIYAKGEAVGVSGSFQVYNFGGSNIVSMLKLGYLDFGSSAYVAPDNAYMVNGFATSASEATEEIPSETPGFGLFGFRIGDQITATIVGLMESGKMTFAYQRDGGMTGVPVQVDLGMAADRNEKWSECIDALLLSDR